MKRTTVYIGDNFYRVHEGEELTVRGLTANRGEEIVCQSKLSEQVIIDILDTDGFVSNIYIKAIISQENANLVEEVVVEENEPVAEYDFEAMTKKQLIQYIIDSDMNINYNKMNKATLIDSIKSYK